MNTPAIPARAQYFDNNGAPLSGGRVTYYEAGTSTLKTVYTTRTGSTPATNPHYLDAGGFVRDGGLWLGEGFYKEVVEYAIDPPAAGEEAEQLDVIDMDGDYNGTYVHVGEDSNGHYVWQCEEPGHTSYFIGRYTSGPTEYYGLFNTNYPFINPPIAYRTVSSGIVGDWSEAGLTVGYLAFATLWTQDDIEGAPIPDPNQATIYLSGMQALRDLTPGTYTLAYIKGYYDDADGGEGFFAWDATNSDLDNGGTIISPTGSPATGRWIRLVEQEVITPNLFGAIPNSALVVGSNITNMIVWVLGAPHKHIYIPAGEYNLGSNVSFYGDYFLEIEDGAYFNSTISCTLTIGNADCLIHGMSNLANHAKVTIAYNPLNPTNYVRPEWLGATGNGSTDDWDAFKRLPANANGREIRLAKRYSLVGPGGGDTLTLGDVVFEGRSDSLTPPYITKVSSVCTLTIDRYREEGLLSYIFRGTGFRLGDMSSVKARHWIDPTTNEISATIATRICVTATNNGGHHADLVFDLDREYTFTADFSTVDTITLTKTRWVVETGARINWDTFEVYIPSFEGGFNTLSKTATGTLYVGCDINPVWFGAISNYAIASVMSNNITAFEQAMKVASDSYPNALDGRSGTFYFNAGISSGTGGLKLRNVTLEPPTGTFWSSANSALVLEDVRIGDGATISLKYTGTGTVVMHNCYIQDDIGLLGTSINRFEAIGNTFRGSIVTVQAGTGELHFVGNRCTGAAYALYTGVPGTITGNRVDHAGGWLQLLEAKGTVSGNTFRNASCVLTAYDGPCSVVGNVFERTSDDATLNINGTGSSTVTGLVVTGNSWVSNNGYTTITTSGIASTGHKATIVDNQGIGCTIPSTRVRGTTSWLPGVGDVVGETIVTLSPYILPYTTNPVRGYLTASNFVGVPVSGVYDNIGIIWSWLKSGTMASGGGDVVVAETLPDVTIMSRTVSGTPGTDVTFYADYEFHVSDAGL